MICVFSLTEYTIFMSSNWTVNQSSEKAFQVVNTFILVFKVQTLSSCISFAASKILSVKTGKMYQAVNFFSKGLEK